MSCAKDPKFLQFDAIPTNHAGTHPLGQDEVGGVVPGAVVGGQCDGGDEEEDAHGDADAVVEAADVLGTEKATGVGGGVHDGGGGGLRWPASMDMGINEGVLFRQACLMGNDPMNPSVFSDFTSEVK
ncbi:Auxin-responsive GH3 family protein [Perilla frutescens var. hirtella]|nr:Auxin-responsive GH3 family protein [Perilla frutescens var. hirtella]